MGWYVEEPEPDWEEKRKKVRILVICAWIIFVVGLLFFATHC
jgi:hypothetical protein